MHENGRLLFYATGDITRVVFIFATFQSNTVTVFFVMPKMHFKMMSANGVCYKIIAYDSTDKVSKDAKRQGPDQTARVI